jgi:NADPH:quinone reductase-like Zn-dependent oxidoreductase
VIDGGRAWQERRDRRASHSRARRLRCTTPPLVGARNLAPLPADADFTVGASAAMPGLTAWQGLVEHGRLRGGERPRARAAGAVGSMVTQLARESGAYVIGTGRAADRQRVLDFGAQEFVDLENDAMEDVGGIDLVSMSSAATSGSGPQA